MLDPQILATLTERFYQRASADPVLGPVIAAAIPAGKMAEHQAVFSAFWARFLLGAEGYKGNAFTAHSGLPLKAAHFARWLEIFAEVAVDCLPAELAARALAQAQHMSRCLQGGTADDQRVAWPLGRAVKPTDGAPAAVASDGHGCGSN